MDITFDCHHCSQSLVIDSVGANLPIICPNCSQNLTVPSPPPENLTYQEIRQLVLARDGNRCVACQEVCERGEADVHHLIPRGLGGPDEPSNLVTLCDGCHGAHHPNLQMTLSRRFIERWALRLAKWFDKHGELPDATPNLGGVLRLLGLNTFRPNQLEVVLAALKGDSVLLVSPTGSGKTLCFQLPGLLRPGTAFIISPLKALMNDQTSSLQRKKIPSSFVNGDLGPEEKLLRYRLLEQRALKFFYCTPERFDTNMVRAEEVERLAQVRPSYLVVDEAHCIDRWGSDFRPNYSRLGAVKELLGNPPILAFTATAGIKTQKRILQSLGVPKARVVVTGVDRPNIALLRVPMEDDGQRFYAIKKMCESIRTGRAMLFVPTRKVGEYVQASLDSLGMSIPFYHSKCGSANERDMLLGRFVGRMEPVVNVTICTNAFGMGLDVPDVRLVMHWQHPASVEDYLQEFGRAGRDGKQSVAVLFTNDKKDVGLLEYMAKRTVDEAGLQSEQRELVLKGKMSQIMDLHDLTSSRTRCFRQGIIGYFQEAKPLAKKSLALRIVEWLMLTKEKTAEQPHCCDHCDSVVPNGCADWVKSVLIER